MLTAADSENGLERSSEPLWHLAQHMMIQAFNEANEAKRLNFKCWPVLSRGEDDRHCNWIVVIVTDEHGIPAYATNDCRIRIDDSEWWAATRIPNPSTTILVQGQWHCTFSTYQVKVPRNWGNPKQPLFTPLEMTRGVDGEARIPVLSEARRSWARLRLTVKSTPLLDDQIRYKTVPEAVWKFHDESHYQDIYRQGTLEEAGFEAEAIRDFNAKSIYQCWLVLCHPGEDELPQPGSVDITRQQCIVIVASPDSHAAFPKVGELCDLAFAVKIPELDNKDVHNIRDNQQLKRPKVKYIKGVRLDNPYDKFNLDGSKWSNYSTFKVSVYRKSVDDYSPFKDCEIKLDPETVASGYEGDRKPRIALDDSSSFQAHVWVDISDTTMRVELNALKAAMKQPIKTRMSKAFTYIRTLENPGTNFDLFQAFPHMKDPDSPNSQLPHNIKVLFQSLDEDQMKAYKTVLSALPCRVGIFAGGPGVGKTQLLLTIAALALSKHTPLAGVNPAPNEETESTGGPIIFILEANRPANVAATRVVEHFEKLGRTDLRIIRSYNFNYEGLWSSRKCLKVDEDDEASSVFNFDQCFPTHRSDHIPQVRYGGRSDCGALTLKEAAQQYLAEHPEDFPLLSTLLLRDPKGLVSDDDYDGGAHRTEWYCLFSAVLSRTDIVVTTPVGAAKISQHASQAFRPSLVIFDDAARARELSTLVAIAHFPSAEAWLFTGTCEMTQPYVGSYENPNLWNPCAQQLKTSMMERRMHVLPDVHRLSLNHQAYGNLHHLSSDLFWNGKIQSAFPDIERFPPSTMHLLEYCRKLASNSSLSVPRLLVHVKGTRVSDPEQKSKFNKRHLNWVMQRVVRDLIQDPNFRSTDTKAPGSILIATPYKSQFSNYRKEINSLMQELDREHRLAGRWGDRLHREVLVEARTADTVQGHSADVVIYDLVHSELTSHAADSYRTCVALTRAKQAEIVVIQKSMLGWEGPTHSRRRFRLGRTHIDLLWEHCKSNGQVVTVDMEEDSHVEKDYTLQQGSANLKPGQDVSAVPRQLPALPMPVELPKDREEVDTPRAVPTFEVQPPTPTHDDDDSSMFQSSEQFSFEMVRKAMELGLNLSSDMPKDE